MARLSEEDFYHVFNKSIADFKIFNNESEFSRMINTVKYYQAEKPQIKFSQFIKQFEKPGEKTIPEITFPAGKNIVSIIAYCIMPTHFHFILRQLKENGISIFTNNILNSYSHYFNLKYKRKGPLWEGRSKRILIESDEQMLQLTRYIHLNPVTAYLVNKPEQWPASSYREYVGRPAGNKVCDFADIFDNIETDYKEFVENNIGYQRDLAKIKKLIL